MKYAYLPIRPLHSVPVDVNIVVIYRKMCVCVWGGGGSYAPQTCTSLNFKAHFDVLLHELLVCLSLNICKFILIFKPPMQESESGNYLQLSV
jgi:hypothetical protein